VLVSPGHVACRQHWLAVPRVVRQPLVEAFRERTSNPNRYARAVDVAEALVRHYQAQR